MGYILMVGECVNCHQPFSFNPVTVPSVRVNGEKEPVCLSCITWANVLRKEKGLEPFAVKPDAYEFCSEHVLD